MTWTALRSHRTLTILRPQRIMKTSLLRFFLLIAAALAACAALSAIAPSGAKLTFRRVFKGSSPEFIEITVREDSDTAAYEIRRTSFEDAPKGQLGAGRRNGGE